MPSDIALQGQLGAISFSELARQIHQHRLSGTLTLTQGPVKKVIQFSQGQVCGTASNLPQDSILGVLVRQGHLQQSQADEIRQQVAAGRRLGQALLESGHVTREVLAHSQFDQISSIFSSLCAWAEGDYSFEAGTQTEGAARLAVSDLLLSAARQFQNPEELRHLFGDGSLRIELAAGAMERCAGFRLQPQEGYLLTRLDVPMTLDELLMISGLPETDTLKSLYALECAELIIISGRKVTARAATAASRQSAPVQPPPSPAPASAPASIDEALARHQARTASSDEATQEEIVRMARLAAESNDDYEILGLAPGATRSEIKNAYTKLAKKYHPDRYKKEANEAILTALKEIFARIRKAYESLRERAPEASETPVPPAAPKEEPKVEHYDHGGTAAAFKVNPVSFETNSADAAPPAPQAAQSWTPPSFEPTAPAAAPPSESFVQAPAAELKPEPPQPDDSAKPTPEEAPDELTTEEASPLGTAELHVQGAELNFQHAIARYQSNDLIGAIELMTTAVELAPDNAFYHSQLATLLAINPRRRKEAEAHLLRACEIEPQNPEWFIHLGQLYKTLSFVARAEAQFKKALSLDPNNQAARRELRALQALKQGQPGTGHSEASDSARKSASAKGSDSSVSDLIARAKETSVSDLFSKLFKRK
jgi:tetratricopeptide (TPR) repeat protein